MPGKDHWWERLSIPSAPADPEPPITGDKVAGDARWGRGRVEEGGGRWIGSGKGMGLAAVAATKS